LKGVLEKTWVREKEGERWEEELPVFQLKRVGGNHPSFPFAKMFEEKETLTGAGGEGERKPSARTVIRSRGKSLRVARTRFLAP